MVSTILWPRSARLSNYNGFLVSLTSLFQGSLLLSQWRRVDAAIVEQLRAELELVSTAISKEVSILSATRRPGERLAPGHSPEAFSVLIQKVEVLRDQGFLGTQPLQAAAIVFGTHFAALRSLKDELINIRDLTEELPRFDQPLPEAKPHWDLLPQIDWFWVRVGIKGGLVGVIAITLLKWIHPPGPSAFPLMAWIQTVLTRPFVRAGGTGDQRVFQNSFFGSLVLIGCNFWILLAYLGISVFVGLNPQEPVASQDIIDSFIGLMVGMFVAALVGRLIWPVLPQRLLKDNLLDLFAGIQALLREDPYPEKVQARLIIRRWKLYWSFTGSGCTGILNRRWSVCVLCFVSHSPATCSMETHLRNLKIIATSNRHSTLLDPTFPRVRGHAVR